MVNAAFVGSHIDTLENPTSQALRLPRLLYISDVPASATFGGATLIYRLLQNYPPHLVRIIESDLWSLLPEWGSGRPEKRLPNIEYANFRVGNERLLRSRVGMAYAPYLHLTARLRSWQLRAVKKSFQPEAILTVGHGYSWITAAALARDLDIPLHFIVHDDWPNSNHLPGYFQRWLNLKFSAVYREASSRLCVSLNMAEKYEERYGVKGEVLLPSRAVDTPSYSSPPVSSDIQFPVFAYAGSINSRETAQALTLLAEVLRPLHGKVHLYSAFSSGALKSLGLTAGNIFVQPTLGSNDLISTLRNSAHVLFLPMDFEGSRNAELNFPSKLVDYTATGLPVLIFGPTKCSAVRWASQFPDTAAVVTSNDAETLSREVLRLVEDTTYRSRLGKFALIKGRECFSHAAVTEKFHRLVAI